jgi:hypothetical protein
MPRSLQPAGVGRGQGKTRLFHALSDGTRLSIIERLRLGERCVCDLTGALDGEDVMTPDTNPSECVELRTAQESDLPAVLGLLARAHLPTAGVADAPSHFVMAESEGKLVGVVGLEVYGESALLRSAAVEESWRGSTTSPRFGFSCGAAIR